jgi:hypothetical protein
MNKKHKDLFDKIMLTVKAAERSCAQFALGGGMQEFPREHHIGRGLSCCIHGKKSAT